jgi:integrase
MASDEFITHPKSRQPHKLSARAVATAKRGRHGDGAGLWLIVSPMGAKKWVFRFSWARRPTEMGLGGYPAVSLAEAREKAAGARKLATAGTNPIQARKAQASQGRKTFGECADALLAAKASEWRNEKHRQQWAMTLGTYAAPLRSRPVDEIDTETVLGVLQPLWRTTPETALRLRGRIEAVLDAARAKGYIPRNEANPARWRGHLDKLLPKRGKLTRGHLAAMPYTEVPAFLAALREREAMAALALEFLILTAARSGEVLGARWSEIDLDAKVWIIPPARMKAAREHRVPLSGRAMAILARLYEAKTGEHVFSGQRPGKPLSPAALTMVLRRLQINRATIHGFRSSFRDWAGNETHFPRELAEAALAHVIGDKAEQAYRRSDALEKRRALMEAWAVYCEPRDASNVIVLGTRA